MNTNKILSYRSIQGELICSLYERYNDNYYQELRDTFKKITSKIKKYETITAGNTDEIKISAKSICKKMEEDSKKLLRFVNYYLDGRISSCYNAFQKWWKNSHFEYFDDDYKTAVFYRMRKREDGEEGFTYEDLLHIPFHLRGKITNQRYSICGFPCLYVSTSLYQTWEELRRPYLQHLYAVAMRFTEELSFLDMRLRRDITSEKQLRCYLQRLPLIIACSIKVKNNDDAFKPEYIIPQTLLHTIIQNGIDGILYSSMRKDFAYYDDNQWDYSKNENIVIPVKSNSEKGLCHQLSKMIEVSTPLNIEQEMIKGSIKMEQTNNYKSTLFGQLESRLNNVQSYFPTNRLGFKGGFGLGLNHSQQGKTPIMHLLK